MHTVKTIIEFASVKSSASAQTGDLVFLFVIISVLALVSTALLLAYRFKFSQSSNFHGNKILNVMCVEKSKITLSIFAGVLLISFTICGIMLLQNKSYADIQQASATDRVLAYVDDEAQEIRIENSCINVVSDTAPLLKTLDAHYCDGVEAIGDASWEIYVEGSKVYDASMPGSAAPELALKDNNTVSYKIKNVDIEKAKSLIGQDVAYINYNLDIYYYEARVDLSGGSVDASNVPVGWEQEKPESDASQVFVKRYTDGTDYSKILSEWDYEKFVPPVGKECFGWKPSSGVLSKNTTFVPDWQKERTAKAVYYEPSEQANNAPKSLVLFFDNLDHSTDFGFSKEFEVIDTYMVDPATGMPVFSKWCDKAGMPTIQPDALVFDKSFAACKKLKSATIMFMYLQVSKYEGLEYFRLENLKEANQVFSGNNAIEYADFTHLDTSVPNPLKEAFVGMGNVKSIKFGGKCTFAGCESLSNLVGRMPLLESFDFNGIDVSNIKDMNNMFSNCTNLKHIEFSNNMNTQKLEDTNNMFAHCLNLSFATEDFKKFDTSNVKNMNSMFMECNGSEILDLTYLNTSSAKDMGNMFQATTWTPGFETKIKNIILGSNFTTNNATSINFMFDGLSKLESIDLSSFDTHNTQPFYGKYSVLSGCTALSKFTISSNWTIPMNECGVTGIWINNGQEYKPEDIPAKINSGTFSKKTELLSPPNNNSEVPNCPQTKISETESATLEVSTVEVATLESSTVDNATLEDSTIDCAETESPATDALSPKFSQ